MDDHSLLPKIVDCMTRKDKDMVEQASTNHIFYHFVNWLCGGNHLEFN